MDNLSENISKVEKKARPFIFWVIITAAIGIAYYYLTLNYVIIRFDELGALSKNMSVYYNGFKIGRVVRIAPDKDFKHTLVRVNLVHKNIKLPQNTVVRVETLPNGEMYLQFVYPESPSLKQIARGDILEGITRYSLEDFMLGQNISGVSDVVSMHVIKTLNATELANKEIELFFKTSTKLINDNDRNVKHSTANIEVMTKNLAEMSQNLNQISQKLNNSIDQENIKNTTINIEEATSNIAEATKSLDNTMGKVDTTAENLNSITSGLNTSLSKRFGGIRVLFGTPTKVKP